MKCNICETEIDVPKIKCPLCFEEQTIINSEIIEQLISLYKQYKNKVIQYSKERYDDNYKTIAIKNTHIGIYNQFIYELSFMLKEYANIDTKNIKVDEYFIETPRVCDINKNKICNHCGDC